MKVTNVHHIHHVYTYDVKPKWKWKYWLPPQVLTNPMKSKVNNHCWPWSSSGRTEYVGVFKGWFLTEVPVSFCKHVTYQCASPPNCKQIMLLSQKMVVPAKYSKAMFKNDYNDKKACLMSVKPYLQFSFEVCYKQTLPIFAQKLIKD